MCPSSAGDAGFFWYTQISSELEHLRLVEMCNRLEVRRAIPILDEESLRVFQAVWCAGHGVPEAICMVVLEHFASALLEVGGSYNTKIRFRSEPDTPRFSSRRLGDHRIQCIGRAVDQIRQNDFAFPAITVLRYHSANAPHLFGDSIREP